MAHGSPRRPDPARGERRRAAEARQAGRATASAGEQPRPTSRDVARAAGVSQATVSLVLGDKWRGRVSERTAGLVRDAARELGYRPNLAARNLRLGRTRTALLVVPALTNEFFARVYTGAATVAAEHGFGVVLYPSPEGIGPAKDPFASARAALDGVIASSMAAEALTAIRGTDLPLVMLDSDPADPGAAAHVNLDIADGMRQMTDHLLALGHRRFVHLASAVASWTFDVRARALHEHCVTSPTPSYGPSPRRSTWAAHARPWSGRSSVRGRGPPPSSATTTSWPPEPARRYGGWACGCPRTSPSPASTTSRSPPPWSPSSPRCACPRNGSASAACPRCSRSSTAARPRRATSRWIWSYGTLRPPPPSDPVRADRS